MLIATQNSQQGRKRPRSICFKLKTTRKKKTTRFFIMFTIRNVIYNVYEKTKVLNMLKKIVTLVFHYIKNLLVDKVVYY
jgi:hypothetical protein